MTADDRATSSKGRRDAVRAWHRRHSRSYPWRETSDRWVTLLAEMLLRRTRSDQVAEHFPKVVRTFPDPRSMANASIAEIEEVIRPLGLTRRAAELLSCADIILTRFNGTVPDDVETLRLLPGVGPYVASVVASTGTRRRMVLIDTNTVRVATRVAGLELEARDIRRQKVVVAAVEDLLEGPATERMWWAIMDLAALVCRPTDPLCLRCPLEIACSYAKRSRDPSQDAGTIAADV